MHRNGHGNGWSFCQGVKEHWDTKVTFVHDIIHDLIESDVSNAMFMGISRTPDAYACLFPPSMSTSQSDAPSDRTSF